MIQTIYPNLFQQAHSSKKYYGMQPSEEILSIQKKLASGMKVETLSEEEYKKLNHYEVAQSQAFYAEVYMEMGRAEVIAIKIAKGESLTPEEEQFINESYPDLKREANRAKEEGEQLKKRLQHAKTESARQNILSAAMGTVVGMAQKGFLSEVQVRIQMAAIEKAKEEAEQAGCKTGCVQLDVKASQREGLLFDQQG